MSLSLNKCGYDIQADVKLISQATYITVFTVTLTLLHPIKIFGQFDSVVIADANNGEIVTKVDFYSGEKLITTAENGTISNAKIEDYGVFEIRAHGYQSKICYDLKDSIFLYPYSFNLSEVNVEAGAYSNSKRNLLNVGFFNSDRLRSTMTTFSNSSRIAVFVPNKYDCPMQIREINLALKNDQNWDYEINLLSVDDKGLPNEVVYSVYIRASDKVNSKTIMVTDSTVMFPPEGVVVSTIAKRHVNDQFEIRNGSLFRSGQDHRERSKYGLNVLMSEEYNEDRMYLMTKTGWVTSSTLRPEGVENKTPRFGLTVSPCVH